MKKILISASIISAVAALAVVGTVAFFSDTETSSGNTFTAGNLDLRFQTDADLTGGWADVNGNPLFGGVTFPLNDLKPGDKGEKTVKLWVDDNPACGFVDIDVTSDLDNSCTEPEQAVDAEDGACVDLSGNGELNDEVKFLIWKDNSSSGSCDNILNNEETPLISGPITEVTDYGLGGLSVDPICYGIAYCFGTWNMQDGTCNGESVGNEAQSDSFSADLTIRAEQYRNQFDAVGAWPVGCSVGL